MLAALATALEVTVVLIAWMMVVRRAAPAGVRMSFAVVVFVGSWLLTCALSATHAPHWMVIVGAAQIVASVTAAVGALNQLCSETDAEDADGDGGGGASLHPRTPGPTGPGGDSEPSWWPQFERDFAEYLAEVARGDQAAGTITAGATRSKEDPVRRARRVRRVDRRLGGRRRLGAAGADQ